MTVSRLIELLSDISVSDPRHPDERPVKFLNNLYMNDTTEIDGVGVIKSTERGKEVVYLTSTGNWGGVFE